MFENLFTNRDKKYKTEIKFWEENPENKKHFAFLSEAKGVNGSPVIIFPECPEFNDLHAQDLCSLMAQLTILNCPSPDVGFTLIIDRRNESSTTVKKVLKRITWSFPANLQLVLVLKSMYMVEKFIFGMFIESVTTKFKGNVPVLILDSLLDIYDYIKPFHLIPELHYINEQKGILPSMYSHLKISPQLQISQKLCLSDMQSQLEALKTALENQLIHCETLKRERDETLVQGEHIKDCLKEMVEKHKEALQVIDQMSNEKVNLMMEMKKLQAETHQELAKKDMDLERANRVQIKLKNQLKDAEKEKQALMSALEEQLEQSNVIQREHNQAVSQRNNLKDCLVEMQVNYNEVLLSNEQLNNEKISLMTDLKMFHQNITEKCGTGNAEGSGEYIHNLGLHG